MGTGHRATVLNLYGADLPGRALERVETAREWSTNYVGPGGEPADPEVASLGRYAPEFA